MKVMLARSSKKMVARAQVRLLNEKAMARKPNRVPLRSFDDTVKDFQDALDEEGTWVKPGPFDWPYMTFKETEVNYTIPAQPGSKKDNTLEQTMLTDEQYKVIEEMTTITKENILASQQDWAETEPDFIQYETIIEDIMEMYLKGVPKIIINTYLNTISSYEIRNWNFTRIDS